MNDQDVLFKLDTALNAVALDADSYKRGYEVFYATLEESVADEVSIGDLLNDDSQQSVIDKAIQHALLSASPMPLDFELYWAAYELFWDTTGEPEEPEADKKPGWLTNTRNSLKSNGAKLKSRAPIRLV